MDGVKTNKQIKLSCPSCEQITNANIEVGHLGFFLNYYHKCDFCDYVITESEWNDIDHGSRVF